MKLKFTKNGENSQNDQKPKRKKKIVKLCEIKIHKKSTEIAIVKILKT